MHSSVLLFGSLTTYVTAGKQYLESIDTAVFSIFKLHTFKHCRQLHTTPDMVEDLHMISLVWSLCIYGSIVVCDGAVFELQP